MSSKSRGSENMQAPATQAALLTFSDTTDLQYYPKALWCNKAGAIVGLLAQDYDEEGGDPDPFTFNVNVGPVPLIFRRIFETGTTAEVIGLLL